MKTFGKVAEYWLSDPTRTIQAQSAITSNFIQLWSNTLRRFSGETPEPVVPADPTDKRFADPEWQKNPIFDFLRQAYSLSTNWASDLVKNAQSLDPETRNRAQFYLRQIAGAVSPSNFLPTNPELLRDTIAESGENLVRGMQMFAEDIEAGHGQLKIRQSSSSKFQLGVNMAVTPGKVVFRNDLFELIQYTPATETVFKRPLLIVPPWINKFYVLDLNPEKSFIRWAVSQGLTVFVISWVNPDERQAEKSFEDYMREGILTALDAIELATGEREVTAIGYCVGGTLLAITLAYMAQVDDRRIASATLFTTQVDFTDPGDLKHFVDEERIRSIETTMADTGYLEGARMASAFNMLRPNELIWSYVVNNYLKGKEPPAFDLLVWNSDSTRMPKANHSFYLRNCYLENNLSRGRLQINGKTLDLGKVTIPVYNLAAREDHIAPARSVFNGAKLFGGEMRYVLSGSGHIAGVVNPMSKPKYQYWTGPQPSGTFEDWLKLTTEHPGSWWADWIQWIEAQAPERVPARTPGEGKLPALCDAPGEYVRVKS
jgi:polyhydroxyalkanoate synthase